MTDTNAPRLPDQLPPDWQPPADLVDAIRKDTMTTETTPTEPRYPDVTVRLIGEDGNAFYILGKVQRALRDAGAPADDVKAFMDEATSGDYNHLLATAMRWVEVE